MTTLDDFHPPPRDLTPREHDFALILGGIDGHDEAAAEAIYGVCDDATLALQRGVVTLDFTRVAPTMHEAILSAIGDVHSAGTGAYVKRVDDCLFVTQAEIAARANLTPAAISNYVNGKRAGNSFPTPCCHITEGQPLWRWCEVAYWLRRNGNGSGNGNGGWDAFYDSTDVETINMELDRRWASHVRPTLFAETAARLDDLYQGVDAC